MAVRTSGWAEFGNVETIKDCLIRNPHFHDCEITRLELERAGPILPLSIEVPDRGGLIDSKREVKIRFTGAADLELQDSGWNRSASVSSDSTVPRTALLPACT